jgi:hypothetical protein
MVVLATFDQENKNINIHRFDTYGYNDYLGLNIYTLKESNDLEELEKIEGLKLWKNNRYTIKNVNLINENEWNLFCNLKSNLNSLNKFKGFDASLNLLFSIFERQISNSIAKKSLLNLARNECFNQKLKEQDLKEFMLNELPF